MSDLCATCGKNPATVFRITDGDRFTWTAAIHECRSCVDEFHRKQDEARAERRAASEKLKKENYRKWLGYDD